MQLDDSEWVRRRRLNLETRHEPITGHPDVSVRMVREDLNAIPVFELPDGYTLRLYEPGDDAHWLRIHRECESYGALKPDLFQDQFGRDESVLAQRVAFVCRADGRPVSTNTAWMNDWNGKEWGRVHWVATSRGEQGKSLSKPLMTAVCERLRELGHDCAYLTTNTLRIRAISLYAALGFEPYWETDKEKAAWEDVEEKMREIGRTVGTRILSGVPRSRHSDSREAGYETSETVERFLSKGRLQVGR